MSLRIVVPVAYSAMALKRNGSRPKSMLFREDVEFDVPVFDEHVAPVAISWRDRGPQGQVREHFTRWVGGAHLSPAVGRPSGDEGKLREYVVRSVKESLRTYVDTVMSGDLETFDPSQYAIVDGRKRNQALMGVDHFASRFAVVGDALHQRVQDPAYYVNRAHKQRPGAAWSYAIRPIEMASASLTTRYFSLNDFDSVLEYSAGAAEKNGRYEVDILMPETLSIDPSEQDLYHAGIAVKEISNHLISGGLPWGFNAPEVMAPWHELCLLFPQDFRGDYGFLPNDFDYDRLAELIGDIYPYLWADSAEHPRETLRTDLKYVREALDMYRERPLEFSPAGMGM